MTSTTTTAVCDRIVDGETTVLLLEGGDESRAKTQLTVDVTELPSDGRHEGAVFEVTYDDDRLLEATYQPETTQERREATQEKFDRLSERLDE